MTTELWLLLAVICAFSGLFYRLGGMGASGKQKYPWAPAWIFDTKVRDWGCPALGILVMIFIVKVNVDWWIHLIGFGLYWAALTTYWDKVFGYDNFYAHGLGCALSYLPYAIVLGFWKVFIIRCIVLAIAMGLWSYIIKKDWLEEGGRGVLLQLTKAIYTIKI